MNTNPIYDAFLQGYAKGSDSRHTNLTEYAENVDHDWKESSARQASLKLDELIAAAKDLVDWLQEDWFGEVLMKQEPLDRLRKALEGKDK